MWQDFLTPELFHGDDIWDLFLPMETFRALKMLPASLLIFYAQEFLFDI
jgi:hypothetical protein